LPLQIPCVISCIPCKCFRVFYHREKNGVCMLTCVPIQVSDVN
jgi:hypothetical protein